MELIELTAQNRAATDRYIREEWGGPMIVTLGNCYDSRQLPGYLARIDGRDAGAVLYRIEGDECEIAILYALLENRGVGTALLDRVGAAARERGCRRLWLVTTNDNTHAIRYYQRYGFSLKAVHIGALAETRRLKPGLPERGIDDIPLEHEFEFELRLPDGGK